MQAPRAAGERVLRHSFLKAVHELRGALYPRVLRHRAFLARPPPRRLVWRCPSRPARLALRHRLRHRLHRLLLRLVYGRPLPPRQMSLGKGVRPSSACHRRLHRQHVDSLVSPPRLAFGTLLGYTVPGVEQGKRAEERTPYLPLTVALTLALTLALIVTLGLTLALTVALAPPLTCSTSARAMWKRRYDPTPPCKVLSTCVGRGFGSGPGATSASGTASGRSSGSEVRAQGRRCGLRVGRVVSTCLCRSSTLST